MTNPETRLGMTNPETRLGDLIIQGLHRIGDTKFGEIRSTFINADQETFGVPLPTIRKLVKKHLEGYVFDKTPSPLEEEATYLLEQPIFDSKVAGIQILAVISKKKLLTDIKVIEGIIKYTTGWALVDTLATDVVAAILRNNPKEADSLIDWVSSNDKWLRRCSIVSLIKSKDYIKDWARYKKLMLDRFTHERDPYVKKAVRWLKSTI